MDRRLTAGNLWPDAYESRAAGNLRSALWRLRRAGLARFGQVQVSIAEAGEGYVRTAVQAAEEELEEGTDLAALDEGFAVVTPIRAPSEATDVRLNLEAIRVRTPAT